MIEKETIEEIVCGSMHVLVLSNWGRLFSCGFGETFALGHGNNKNLNLFKEVLYFKDKLNEKLVIEKICAGVSHSGILISK